ncbi:MAG: FMN-binding negative transcriptional regulator [Flavobacteriaceae bacterium]
MYNFSYFKEKDQSKILDFITENPFAFLTSSNVDGSQVATQIPLLMEVREGELFLQGHIMRNTDHHKAFSENPNVLTVFTGPNAYVSASWYSNPRIGSTWNYMSVHVNGKMNFMSDDELVSFMKKLTLKFEGGNNQSPTFYDNLADSYVNRMMSAIVGFEIKADKIDNVFKLSQDKDEESYLNIISELEKRDGNSALIANEMQKRKEELFPEGAIRNTYKFDS